VTPAQLRQAYPDSLPDDRAAEQWVSARRSELRRRVRSDGDGTLAVSSGCAASGSARHRRGLADAAETALSRLDAGTLVDCAGCGRRLAFDRLDAAPAVVTCTGCGHVPVDTRWCR